MPPKNPPKIYIDSTILIDMAKHEVGIRMDEDDTENTNRKSNVWHMTKLLEAARVGEVKLYTSSLSVTECTGVEKGQVPNDIVKKFYNMLLRSGKSGITLVQPTMTITDESRDMKWREDEDIKLKPYDSVHLATAIHMGCSELLTTDKDFSKSRYKNTNKINILPARETKLLPEKYRQIDKAEEMIQKNEENIESKGDKE